MIKKLLLCCLLMFCPMTAYATSTDTVFDTDTKLMLHVDGADTSTTITNSSSSGATCTVQGTAQIDTAQSVFGGASLLLDGDSDYVDVSTFDAPANGSFTVDFRFRTTAVGSQVLFDTRTVNTNTSGFMIFLGGSNNIAVNSGGSTLILGSVLSVNTWYHVALTGDGTNLKLYINGTQDGSTYSSGYNFTDTTACIGARDMNPPLSYLNGWVDEVRYVKGTSVWVGAFTPPTNAYTACTTRRIITVT